MKTELDEATIELDVDRVKSLVESGAEITNLAWSCAVRSETRTDAKKRELICRIFLDAGADPNFKNSYGECKLDWAAAGISQKILSMVLEAGADLSMGWPLHCAIEEGRVENLRILLDAGADPEKGLSGNHPDAVEDRLGKTLLEYAKFLRRRKCVKFLTELE